MAEGTLHMQLRILKWEDNPGLSEWAVNVSQVPCKRNAEGDFTTVEKR